MPQEIRVLCCFKCKMYQVDIVKKAKKWQCKICQEKQSVFTEFFRGSGAQCRERAQHLNSIANSKLAEAENDLLDLLNRDDLALSDIDLQLIAPEQKNLADSVNSQFKTAESKWNEYVDEEDKLGEIKVVETDQNKPPTKRKFRDNHHGHPSEAEADCYSLDSNSTITKKKSKWNAYL